MAVATSTALAIGSLAVSSAGAGLSFGQASKQLRLQRLAEQNAAKAIAEAKKQVQVNPFAALGISKEPYELEREAMLAAGAQATQAGVESERGAAATAGRVAMAQAENLQDITSRMIREKAALDLKTAQEEADIKNTLAGIALEEKKGYEAEIANAMAARNKSLTQATQSIQEGVKTGIQTFVPLYLKKRGIDPLTGEKIAGSADTNPMDEELGPNDLIGRTLKAGQTPSSKLNASSFQDSETLKKIIEMNPFQFNNMFTFPKPQ